MGRKMHIIKYISKKMMQYCILIILAMLLSACSAVNMDNFPSANDIFGQSNKKPTPPVPVYPNQTQNTIPIQKKKYKIALFLPIHSASVPIKQAATSLLNAAQLAHKEINSPNMELIVYPIDDSDNTIIPAVQDKIDLIVGPLLSPSVVTVRRYTEPAKIPMLAFSNDQTTVEGGYSYLISYLPEQNIANIVHYAVSQGHKDFGLLASNTPYGKRVGDTFVQEVTARNGRVTNAVYFTENAPNFFEKVKEVTEFDTRANETAPTSWTSILLPDRAGLMMQTLPLFSRYNIDFKKSLILGTGIWNDPRILDIEELNGAVFAAPNRTTLQIFESRYEAMFKKKPATIASLSYDAIALAAGLIRQYPYNPFDVSHITNPNGFNGVGGIFRFRPDGLSERGLSILRIENKKFNTVIPAPDTFAGS
jgi:branched-chain amino acid transport system substrate-binding protein